MGILIQHNTHNSEAIFRLQMAARQICGLLGRVGTQHRGMKEDDLCLLTQAFLVSRIMYSFPYYHLRPSDKEKVNSVIRTAHKAALRLPRHANTEQLLEQGVKNTLGELMEAQKTAQRERLSSTATGRFILGKLGLNPVRNSAGRTALSGAVKRQLVIKPLPKNILPGRHDKRRSATAKGLQERYQNNQRTAYVDAAKQNNQNYVVSVVTGEGRILNAATIRIPSTVEAEETTIAWPSRILPCEPSYATPKGQSLTFREAA